MPDLKLRHKNAGFTLFEMTVVMIIAGILLALLGATLLRYSSENRIKTTQIRSERIQESLSRYLSVNGRYPCVARHDLGADNENFGKEITTSCSSGVVTGTTSLTDIRIGAVPTRSLNLPDQFAADGWGNKFTYAVTKDLATAGAYKSDEGRITIVNSAGANITTDSHYVIVSHGQTGIGSRPFSYENSATLNVIVPCSAAELDEENCNQDNVFMSALVNPTKNDPAFFDDYIFYKGLTMNGLIKSMAVPAGAVLPFNVSSCPPGWTNFFRGERSFVVGSGVPQSVTNHSILPVATQPILQRPQYQMLPESTTTLPVSVGSRFGAITSTGNANSNSQKGNIPPYVALLYCEKLPE